MTVVFKNGTIINYIPKSQKQDWNKMNDTLVIKKGFFKKKKINLIF